MGIRIYGKTYEYRKTGTPNIKSTSKETIRKICLDNGIYTRRYRSWRIVSFAIRQWKTIMQYANRLKKNGSSK